MELQSDPVTDRLLKLSTLIESNCQFLTVVRKCITDEQILQRDNLPTLEEYLEDKKLRINEDSFIQMFIQVAYFVFSCRRYNIQPEVRKQDIRVEQISLKATSQKKFSPIIFYKISDQKQLEPFQSISIVQQIYGFFFAQYAQYLQFFKSQMTPSDNNFKIYIERFQRQVEYLLANSKVYQPNKQKQFFTCLQQSSLFRQCSNLLKIKNCSILDLIKTREGNFSKFKQSKQKDVKLIIDYATEKKKSKTEHDKIKQKQRQIQKNITQLFQYLSKKQGEQKQNQNQTIQQHSSNTIRNDKQQTDKVKLSYKLRQKPVNQFYQSVRKIIPELAEIIPEQNMQRKQQTPEMEYLIEYSSDRNSICVRLIPNQINVHIQNADFLMYQSNILTFQTVNVNIQLVQSLVQQKKTVKKLAFKGTSCLNSKQPPLEKILLLMDATMIAAKICEPQLNPIRVAFSGLSDHERLSLVSNKINHYTRIYLRCAKKVYSE